MGHRRALAAVAAALGLGAVLLAGCSSPAPQTWQVTHTFGPVAGSTDIYSMSALSAADVWATGYSCDPACGRAGDNAVPVMVQHWDGSSWRAIPAPGGLADQTQGSSVSALAADDAWVAAVGQSGAGQSAPYVPYVLHWGDGRWAVHRFATGVSLSQVLAFADDDVWAFGARYADGSGGSTVSVNYHFDGRTWQQFSLPIVADDAAADGPDDIWSTGQAVAGPSEGPSEGAAGALAVHWDGRSWQASRLPTATGTVAGGVVVAGQGDVWTSYSRLRNGGCCDVVGLLHLAGGTWHHVGLPDFGSIHTPTAWMVKDGHGGIWLERNGQTGGPDWLAHYSRGQWTRTGVGTDRGASVTLNGALAYVPDTRQVWVTGWVRTPRAPSGTAQMALLELR